MPSKPETAAACPHCGSTDGYTRRVYLGGYEEFYAEWGAAAEEYSTNDHVTYRDASTVTCDSCGKRTRLAVPWESLDRERGTPNRSATPAGSPDAK